MNALCCTVPGLLHRLCFFSLFLYAFLCRAAETDNASSAQEKKPFFKARTHQARYRGPGRHEPPPEHIKEVLIGYFGPSDPRHPEGGTMWSAVKLAIEKTNQEGGINGRPVRMVTGWSDNPWGSGVAQLTQMAYRRKVWAIIGGIDGPSTHLAEQVVAKARLPLISPASADPSVTLANVPWMFSCLPGGHLHAASLAARIEKETAGQQFLIVSTSDHDPRFFVKELREALSKKRLFPAYTFVYKKGGSRQLQKLTEEVVQTGIRHVVVAGTAQDSASIVRLLKSKKFKGVVYGDACMASSCFLEKAGDAAEGVIFPLLWKPGGKNRHFSRAFRCAFHQAPDYKAAYSYDAVRLLVEAIRTAGLNRAGISDALRTLSPWSGVSGTFRWDPLGSNEKPVHIGTIRRGKAVPAGKAGR